MPRQRRRQGWDPFAHHWGRGRGVGRGRGARWPDGKVPPEIAAERFAAAVEQVAEKVGTAIERAFEEAGEGADGRQVEDVGNRVASALEHAIDKVGEVIPGTGHAARLERNDRRLLRKRDRANGQMILFVALWAGISAVTWLDGGASEALPPMIVLGAVFGALIARAAVWKSSHRQAIERAEERMTRRELGEEAPADDEARDGAGKATASGSAEEEVATAQDGGGAAPGMVVQEPTVDGPLSAVEQEGLQVLELLRELGEERPDIRASVESTVAKTRELTRRRERLDTMLADPDLAGLDERMEELRRRIETTEDEQTRAIYEDTLGQLRAQADSLADVRLMVERLDAYTNASLQSLRTIHIDLLRLQTGDMSDPAQAIRDVSTRADALGLEIKSVREVVEEVDRSRRSRAARRAREL